MSLRNVRAKALVLGLGVLAYAACPAADTPQVHAPLSTGTRLDSRPRVADFHLLDQRGRAFARRDLLGAWSVLLFGYTECPDICPTTLGLLSRVERNLREAHGVAPRVIFASADAVHDSPARLASSVASFDTGFIRVTAASQREVEDFARTIGATVVVHGHGADQCVIGHSSALFVVAPDGYVAAVLTGPFTVKKLQSDFQAIIAGS
jgi:protein SCO1/2